MRAFLIAVAVVVIPSSGAVARLPQEVNPRESADVAELTRLERVWNEAYVRGDADALDRLLADDLIVQMSEMQVLDKTKSIGILRSGRVRFSRYETSDLRIRVYDNAAVVTGRLERIRDAQGHQAADYWRFTKVYVRRNGKWQVVAWHASTVSQ
ncbi:MAG TPA: nuclear transport factor 2 family protein [Blastocatellia bacterium]|jgi:hypothetical protein